MILLDTHIWLWWLLGDGALKLSERDALDKLAHSKELSVSWVSIWETEILERKGRINLEPDFTSWIRAAVHPDICKVLPVDTAVVSAQRLLPETFHPDPADRLITATALLSAYPLFTKDNRIIDSGVVDIWVPQG